MALTVPLAVRLKTARADRHVTKDLRDLNYSWGVPGGYRTCELSLDRPLSLDPDELQQYADLYVYDGRSGETLWQGRLEDPGRAAGPDGQIWSIGAVGPAAQAKDRTVPLIYVDRSLERFHKWYGGSAGTIREQVEYDDLIPALNLQFPRGLAITSSSYIDFVYGAIRSAGMKLARVAFDWDTGITDADFDIECVTRADNGAGTVAAAANSSTAGGSISAVVVTNFTNGDNQCHVRYDYDGANVSVGNDTSWLNAYNVVVRAMLMSAAGADITTGYTLNTVLASEIVADLLGRLLTKFDGASAVIATTTHAIEQLAFPDGITPYDLLENLMQLESSYYWAAWEDGATAGKAQFEWSAWPSTVRYEASAREGFDSPGSAAELFNEVKVRWRDALGRIRTNTRTQTVQALTDAGLTRTARIDLGDDVASSANADRAGDQFLAEHASAPNAGTLTVRSSIADLSTGLVRAPWAINRPGLIRVRDVLPRVDALNPTARDAVTIFKVVGGTYRSSENTMRLELDSKPRTISQIVGRRRPTRRR